ncbi:hypothetical protein COK43_20285 [Bacillus cereus]|nr:hypothetical protein COK43_20285 [Bacillus cereus]
MLIVLIVLSIGGIMYSVFFILKSTYDYHYSAERYKEIGRIYEKEGTRYERTKQVLRINKDYVGWIKINDTKVDYPVVKREDNSFYLSHNFYKEEDRSGSIFMDYKNDVKKYVLNP